MSSALKALRAQPSNGLEFRSLGFRAVTPRKISIELGRGSKFRASGFQVRSPEVVLRGVVSIRLMSAHFLSFPKLGAWTFLVLSCRCCWGSDITHMDHMDLGRCRFAGPNPLV